MIWLIGCKGMLGSEIARQLGTKKLPFVGTDLDVDITSERAVFNFAKEKSPAWIINCAGYTAVDKAEDDADFASKLNALGPLNIANAAKACGAKLIHISTDYVFDGCAKTPYTEDMPAHPNTVYGLTKLDGEKNVLSVLADNFWILRTAWLYGFDGKNFVYTMTRATDQNATRIVVNDQFGTPTFAGTLTNTILTLIEQVDSGKNIECGIYHCTDLGEITWYDFAKEIYALGKKYGRIHNECTINPCTTDAFPAKAKRPAYSVLSKEKIQRALGIKLPQWQENLELFIKSDLFCLR